MSEHVCKCGEGHRTWGDCIRAKNFTIGYCRSHIDNNPARHDRTANKMHERELDAYARARKQGIQPGGTNIRAVRHALDRSDQLGKAYDAASPLGG